MRDKALERLRKLRRRAELLNEPLAGDLQPFLHHLDWSTFRRLPASRSEAGDVSVTTTCTALMTLAVTRERQLATFWGSIRPSAERALRSAVDMTVESVGKAKSARTIGGDLRNELLSAVDSVGLALTFTGQAKDKEGLAVINNLCAAVDALTDLSGWVHSAADNSEIKPRLVGVLKAAKKVAIAAAATAVTLSEQEQNIAPPIKQRITRSQRMAEEIVDEADVKEEQEDPRPGTRDVKQVTEAKADDKLLRIMKMIASLEWRSSLLEEDNAFTAAMFVRTCGLVTKHTGCPDDRYKSIVRKKDTHCRNPQAGRFDDHSVSKIAEALLERPEEVLVVGNYPATSTLGYWLVDAIDTLDVPIEEEQWRMIARWANNEFMRQASLVSARHDALMDPVAMAMAACMLARLVKMAKARKLRLGEGDFKLFPSSAQLLFGIRELFALQGPSGIWPKYFPLFHYPDAGANYCFSFEMLEAILAEFGLQERDEIEAPDVLEEERILEGLERAVQWCEQNRLEFTVPDGTTYRGWNSGGQIKTLSRGMPESWATGAVHMFLTRLRTTLSNSIQRRVLRLASVATIGSRRPDPSAWDKLIDMQLEIRGNVRSLMGVIEEHITKPLEAEGGRITPRVRRSALLFGPPGTSKTSIVKAIAKKVGWPFLEINPAHFLNEGLERIYVRADEVFEDLMDLSGVVVLFDEMDALVQKRNAGDESTERLDVTRQFLTTSMLPKLSKLYERGGVLFFMATNYQSEFDEAIKRPRRFDLLLCMAPPVWKAKVRRLDLFLKSQYDSIQAEDQDYTSAKLVEWAEIGKVEHLLDLFSFDETRLFLEHFFRGAPLREVVDNPDRKAAFTSEVNEWGQQFITLRPNGPIYKIYTEKDRKASRIQ